MACEFCDKGFNSGICIPLGKGSVSFGIDYEDFDKPMFYFELSTPSAQKVRRSTCCTDSARCLRGGRHDVR